MSEPWWAASARRLWTTAVRTWAYSVMPEGWDEMVCVDELDLQPPASTSRQVSVHRRGLASAWKERSPASAADLATSSSTELGLK